MTREDKIKKVYEVIADKELTFGCRYYGIDTFDGEKAEFIFGQDDTFEAKGTGEYGEPLQSSYDCIYREPTEAVIAIDKIIGHDVLIGHCLKWLEKKTYIKKMVPDYKLFMNEYIQEVLQKYKDKTAPIEHPENEEALEFMFDLINTEKGTIYS